MHLITNWCHNRYRGILNTLGPLGLLHGPSTKLAIGRHRSSAGQRGEHEY